MSILRYPMVIVWSDEDGCYLVHFPDFPEQTYRTHGDSYEKAARNGKEILHLLLEEDGLPLPKQATSLQALRAEFASSACVTDDSQ